MLDKSIWWIELQARDLWSCLCHLFTDKSFNIYVYFSYCR